MTAWLAIAAVAIIAVLTTYAGYLYWQLYRRGKQRQSTQPGMAVKGGASLRGEGTSIQGAGGVGVIDPPIAPPQWAATRRRSLYLLADALLGEQLSHTEGCLRICAVASGLDDLEQFRIEYGVLFRVAEATAHIPILEHWKALSGEEQKRFDKEREVVEARYSEAVLDAARRLKAQYPF